MKTLYEYLIRIIAKQTVFILPVLQVCLVWPWFCAEAQYVKRCTSLQAVTSKLPPNESTTISCALICGEVKL